MIILWSSPSIFLAVVLSSPLSHRYTVHEQSPVTFLQQQTQSHTFLQISFKMLQHTIQNAKPENDRLEQTAVLYLGKKINIYRINENYLRSGSKTNKQTHTKKNKRYQTPGISTNNAHNGLKWRLWLQGPLIPHSPGHVPAKPIQKSIHSCTI